jgi:formylglycine-generating enzyme required for sulfatase activity
VGVRIHGGTSRRFAPRNGFRLYFRRRYGARELPRGLLFSPAAHPVRRLVVHDDYRRDRGLNWHLVNPFAYDVARAIGAIAPETKPVRFFVNGEYYGPFVLTERFDERYFAAHWGHGDVLPTQEEMDQLWDWVQRTRPLTMKALSQHVNVDNLTRWFLSVTFLATRDAYQSPAQFIDRRKPAGRWFWVNWDMDQSFRDWNLDSYHYLLERVGEGRRGININRAEPRARILTELIANDPEYREYLMRVVQKALNHQLTADFLRSRHEHYLDVATALRAPHLDYVPRVRDFLDRRTDFFRLVTEQWLNSPPSQPVTIGAPAHVRVVVEGERVGNGYRGLYFPGIELVAEVAPEDRAGFSGWQINGRTVLGAGPLKFTAEQPTHIDAVFNNAAPPYSKAPDSAPSKAPALRSAAPVQWAIIPAGTSWMGCVSGDTRCDAAENPRVHVSIPQPFQMMDREVSVSDFVAFAAAQSQRMPRQPEWYADGAHPVVNITWDEAQSYCAWAGGRLPTEAEWEHAARGGSEGQLFPWGNEYQGQANARHNLPSETIEFTAPVRSFPPTGFGLHDMAGNVWEWTASEFVARHDSARSRTGYDLRTIKGGGWDSSIPRLRVSERAALSRIGRHNLHVGFRCVRAMPQ